MSEEQQQNAGQQRIANLQQVLRRALEIAEDIDDNTPHEDEIRQLIDLELANDNPINFQRLVRRLQTPDTFVEAVSLIVPGTNHSEDIQLFMQVCRERSIEVLVVPVIIENIPLEARGCTIHVLLSNGEDLPFRATVGRAIDSVADRLRAILAPPPEPSTNALVHMLRQGYPRGDAHWDQ